MHMLNALLSMVHHVRTGRAGRSVERMCIADILASIRGLETCSLRMCSGLLRGVARMFVMKMRRCLADAHSLMNALETRRRERRVRRRIVLMEDPEVISSISSIEEHGSSLVFSSYDIPVERRRASRRVFDTVTELDASQMFLSDVSSRQTMLVMERFNGEHVPVIERARSLGGMRESGFSEMHTLSTVKRMRNSSVSGLFDEWSMSSETSNLLTGELDLSE